MAEADPPRIFLASVVSALREEVRAMAAEAERDGVLFSFQEVSVRTEASVEQTRGNIYRLSLSPFSAEAARGTKAARTVEITVVLRLPDAATAEDAGGKGVGTSGLAPPHLGDRGALNRPHLPKPGVANATERRAQPDDLAAVRGRKLRGPRSAE